MNDYVIVGSGPVGIILALCFAKEGKKVTLIDKEDNIGGCHRVRRYDHKNVKNGLFTEHGPRIYSSNYFTFINFLKSLKMDFYEYFVKYDYNIKKTGPRIISSMNLNEIKWLVFYFIFMFDQLKNVTIGQLMTNRGYSSETTSLIVSLCRLSDGADKDKYSVFQFLQIINQNFFYDFYLPKKPNDISLFKDLHDKLIENGVNISLNTEVIEIAKKNNDKISHLSVLNDKKNVQIIEGHNFILAIPPVNIIKILENTQDIIVKNAFGNYSSFANFAHKNNYITYIPVMFYWFKKIKINKIWGSLPTKWGIIMITMSDYMTFDTTHPKTVISSCISKHNISDSIHKTPDECTEDELKKEVFRQIKTIHKNIPDPDLMVMNDSYYENGKWHSSDTAFFYHSGKVSQLSSFNNLYNCGCHNGSFYDDYSFTSLESSSINAITLFNELSSRNKYIIKTPITLRFVIIIIAIFILIIIIIYCKSSLSSQ